MVGTHAIRSGNDTGPYVSVSPVKTPTSFIADNGCSGTNRARSVAPSQLASRRTPKVRLGGMGTGVREPLPTFHTDTVVDNPAATTSEEPSGENSPKLAS